MILKSDCLKVSWDLVGGGGKLREVLLQVKDLNLYYLSNLKFKIHITLKLKTNVLSKNSFKRLEASFRAQKSWKFDDIDLNL